jgi:hypothetical protein
MLKGLLATRPRIARFSPETTLGSPGPEAAGRSDGAPVGFFSFPEIFNLSNLP